MKKLLSILLLLIFIQSKATVYQISSQAQCDAFNFNSLVAGDQVLFWRGKSFKTSFTLSQSGSAGSPIVIGAYGTGANPVITGFTDVTAWTNKGSNIWESTNAVSTLSTCNMVSINGVNTPIGKTPNAALGTWTFQSHTGSTSVTSSDLVGVDWTGAEVVLRIGSFKINRRVITSQTNGTINWSTNTSYEPSDGSGLFIQNDIRTLDQQNEWYYNPTTKKISIYSTTQPTNVKVASLDNLVTLSASYVTIENIDFTGANNAFVYTSSTSTWRNITIRNCSFAFSGNYGINGIRANYYTISNNSFSNCQTQAIQTGGSYLTTHHISVNNNSVENIGMLQGMQNNHVSAITAGKGAVVEYNRVINSGYHGISFYGDSIIIKNNFVNSFCNILEDGGGIYTFTGSSQAAINACKIHGNIVINGIGNTDGMMGTDWPASGIYLDEKTNAVEVYGNTVANCKKYGLFTNSGIANNIHDNTIYNSSVYGVRFNSWGSTSVIFNNNKIICKDATQICFAMTSGTNDILAKITANNNYYASPLGTTDLFYVEQPSTGGDRYKTLSEWKTFSSQDVNSLSSPITVSSDDDIYFYYNDTKADKVIEIEQPSIDVASTAYYTPITLQPFTSVVLIRDATLGNYYYLSTSGSDSNSGTLMSSPWKTLAKANATNFADGDKIYMKAGDVWSGETLTFTNAIQGWDDEILVTSYGTGNKPTISGFETLTSWTSDGNGIYHATVSNSACNMVTVNGVNTPIARYPKTGYLTFETYNGNTSITDNELTLEPSWTGAQAVIRANGFQYTIATVSNHYWHTLTLSGSSIPDATGENKYFLQNHISALTSVGDWYISGNTLYMYFGANNPSNYTVKAAKVAKLVTTDKNYVTLDGIRIEGAIEKGYESTGTHNTVQNCEFEFMGRYGITCAQTTPTIDNNALSNGNGTAIFMNANSYVLKNNAITNNGIYAGMVEPTTNNYFGINIIAGSGGTCEYNTISNVGYIGISTWGSNNIIRYNKVDGFCSILPDGGGIYANYIGSAPYPTGIKVYNNIVKNGGGEGLYSDAVNQNTEWYNNTVSNCISGILLNTPINHSVHDNTFFNCTFGFNFYNWHTNSLTPSGCTVSNNIVVEGTNSTYAVKIGDSTNRDILSMGTVNGNKFYSETGKQTAQFKAFFTPSAPLANYNLADWRTLTGFESTSTLTTLSNFSSWSVYENATKAEAITPLGTPMMDLDGNKFATGVPLGLFMSKVLAIDPNPSSTNPTGKKKVLKTNGKYYINSKTGRFFVK